MTLAEAEEIARYLAEQHNIHLWNMGIDPFLARLKDLGVIGRILHHDPPWAYTAGGGNREGLAGDHYGGLTEAAIARYAAAAVEVLHPDAYNFMWITFPKVPDWFRLDVAGLDKAIRNAQSKLDAYNLLRVYLDGYAPGIVEAAGWRHITGGAWGKLKSMGVGYHFRGAAEILFLYKRGTMMPVNGAPCNLWLVSDNLDDWIDGLRNLWLVAPSRTHSEKPQPALLDILSMGGCDNASNPCIEYYAGERASMARACLLSDVAYYGCEIDTARWIKAIQSLQQTVSGLAKTGAGVAVRGRSLDTAPMPM